jgi:hypothetical protein
MERRKIIVGNKNYANESEIERNYEEEQYQQGPGYEGSPMGKTYQEGVRYQGGDPRRSYQEGYGNLGYEGTSNTRYQGGDPRRNYQQGNRGYGNPYYGDNQSARRMPFSNNPTDYERGYSGKAMNYYGANYANNNMNYYNPNVNRSNYRQVPYYQPYDNDDYDDYYHLHLHPHYQYGPNPYHYRQGYGYGYGYGHPSYYNMGNFNAPYYHRPPGFWSNWWNPGFFSGFLNSPRVNNFLRGVGLVTIGMFVAPSIARAFRPLAVQAVQGVMSVTDEVKTVFSDAKEDIEDMFAEAKWDRINFDEEKTKRKDNAES